jgi:hypothetical protein
MSNESSGPTAGDDTVVPVERGRHADLLAADGL